MTTPLPARERLMILKRRLAKLDAGECEYDWPNHIQAFQQTLNAIEKAQEELRKENCIGSG